MAVKSECQACSKEYDVGLHTRCPFCDSVDPGDVDVDNYIQSAKKRRRLATGLLLLLLGGGAYIGMNQLSQPDEARDPVLERAVDRFQKLSGGGGDREDLLEYLRNQSVAAAELEEINDRLATYRSRTSAVGDRVDSCHELALVMCAAHGLSADSRGLSWNQDRCVKRVRRYRKRHAREVAWSDAACRKLGAPGNKNIKATGGAGLNLLSGVLGYAGLLAYSTKGILKAAGMKPGRPAKRGKPAAKEKTSKRSNHLCARLARKCQVLRRKLRRVIRARHPDIEKRIMLTGKLDVCAGFLSGVARFTQRHYGWTKENNEYVSHANREMCQIGLQSLREM